MLEATKEAMKFSFYDDVDILNASYILLILKVHPDYSYVEMEKLMNMLNVNDDISIVMATSTDSSLQTNYAKVTLVGTGFDKVINESVNNISYSGC